MALRTLVTSLATWGATVSGVHLSCDLQDTPEKVSREQLPILIPVLQLEMPGNDFKAFMGNAPEFDVVIDHLLLFAESEVRAPAEILPDLVTFIDAYNTASIAQKFLNYESAPVKQVVMSYTIDRGITQWTDDTSYHSVTFKHKYTLYL